MSKAPPEHRRRRKPSPARKLRPFWFLLTFVFALIVLAAYFFATWPALDPKTVEVSGNHMVSRDAILASARIDMSQNLWLQNTHAMEARVEALPYIDRAAVHRRPPAQVSIVVTERTPYAQILGAGGIASIDDRMRVLQEGPANGELPQLLLPALRLPEPGATIDSSAVRSLAHIIDRAQAANLSVETIGYDRFGDVTMTLRSGVRVMLGDASDLETRLAMVQPILTQVHRGAQRIAAIDLRAIGTPVVVYAK